MTLEDLITGLSAAAARDLPLRFARAQPRSAVPQSIDLAISEQPRQQADLAPRSGG